MVAKAVGFEVLKINRVKIGVLINLVLFLVVNIFYFVKRMS